MSLRQNARAAGIYAGAKFASYGVNLLVLPILTRLLTPADFGVIALAWLFPAVAVSVFTCGLSASAQRYYFEYRNDPQKLHAFFITSQFFLFASLAVFAALIWPLQNLLAKLIMANPAYGRALYWAAIASYLSQIVNFYSIQWQNMERPGLAAGVPLVQAVLTTALGLCFVLSGQRDYMGPIYGALISPALVCCIACWHFNRGTTGRFNLSILRENIAFGLQVVPKSFSSFIPRFFDKYMLNNILSLDAVGIYNIGQSLGNSMSILMNTVWSALQPVCYREVFDNRETGAREAGKLFTVFAYLALLPVLGGALFAPELMTVIAPPSYHAAIDVTIVILAGMATQTFGMYCGVQFAYAKKAYWIFPLTAVGTLANVAGNMLMIPRLGLLGAAASVAAMMAVSNGALTTVAQRVYPLGYQWLRLVLIHGTVIAAAAFVVTARRLEAAWPVIYFGKLVFLGLYGAVGAGCGVITRERIDRLMQLALAKP